MILNEDTKDIYNLMKFVDEAVEKVVYNKLNDRISNKYLEKYREFKLQVLLNWMKEYHVNKKETPRELEEYLYNMLLDFYNMIKLFLK
jgi:hypothetical protein